MVATPLPGRRTQVMAYVALTKPRIIELLLVTTLPTMVVAARGMPRVGLMVATLVGGALAAAGANVVNMWADRDIDKLMARTAKRPLVTGELTPTAALVFAVILEVLAFVELWWLANPLSACLALSATLFYVFVYTLWLKRTSTKNIVIGGAAGAVPVLVGWAAVRNELGLAPLLLFAIIFVWTPPHFWALALVYRKDYEDAAVPMMPIVAGDASTRKQIFVYAILTVLATLVFVPLKVLGLVYGGVALVLGGYFVYLAAKLLVRKDNKTAYRLFAYSIIYLALLFGAMVADRIWMR